MRWRINNLPKVALQAIGEIFTHGAGSGGLLAPLLSFQCTAPVTDRLKSFFFDPTD
jgi:hypothetical protein